jgi:predicted nucleic acid-binding protein
MASNLLATPEVFLDTAYAIALSAPHDSFHQQALLLADEIEAKSVKLITTQAILLEIGNALAAPYYRRKAGILLESLETDERVHIVTFSTALYNQALQLFQTHHDKAWGITDCISFVVMRERGIAEALTADRHFQQAGFRTLLRDT